MRINASPFTVARNCVRGVHVTYITVEQEASDEFVEKKSRFIGYCCPVTTGEEAVAFIEAIKKKHWDATHNVPAYILREGGLMRFSDDGEPQGKAGIPVLDAMKKNNITDAAVVATRYFGGILLGGGGLIRAYSHTASIAIAAAKKIIRRECSIMMLNCDYHAYGRVNAVVPECGGIIDDTQFLDKVTLSFHISPTEIDKLQKKLMDATGGQTTAVEIEKQFFTFPFEE